MHQKVKTQKKKYTIVPLIQPASDNTIFFSSILVMVVVLAVPGVITTTALEFKVSGHKKSPAGLLVTSKTSNNDAVYKALLVHIVVVLATPSTSSSNLRVCSS